MRSALFAVLVLSLMSPIPAFADDTATTPSWLERVNIYGTIEGDYAWSKHSDIIDKDSGSSSDLLVSTVELGLDIEFSKTVTGSILFLAEDLGTDDETDAMVDEATLTIQTDACPFYVTAGKRVVPFGMFESGIVADPMTVDAYETSRPGVTLGYGGPMDSDVSLTVYKGEEQMEHLFESGLFDSDAVARIDGGSDNVESFVLSASFSPVQKETYGLTVFGGFLSEPGRDDRNNTVNIGLSFTPFVIEDLEVYFEYMKALEREIYAGQARAYEESVLSLTVAYPVAMFDVAIIYEHYDDDGLNEETGAWSVSNRYGIGGSYTIFESDAVETFIAGEYRRTEYREQSPIETMASSNNEIIVRLGASF